MKVFISSIISGFEPCRAAARSAIMTLRHQPVMAEDFGAKPLTPQIACLTGIRESDVVLLLLGEHYGAVQSSGMSATEEEYREARQRKQVIAFIQKGIEPDDRQKTFISEVEGWSGGVFRDEFRNVEELREGVTRALHDYDIAHAVGPVDSRELAERSVELLGVPDRQRSGSAVLSLAIAGGPLQNILRPIEIEAEALSEELHQAALFGPTRVFDRAEGVETGMEGSSLVLKQGEVARIQLSEDGSVLLQLPISQSRERARSGFSGFPSIIEEDVKERITVVLAYASWLLERIDSTQRLTHVSIATRVDGSEHMSWTTQTEYDASARSGSYSMGQGRERHPVQISHSRAALRLNRGNLVEDLLVPLRRQWKN